MDTLEAESQMVEEHIPFLEEVVSCMMKHFPPHIDFEDLYGYGLVGLWHGVQGYDPSRGTKFRSFAQLTIRSEVLKEHFQNTWAKKTTWKRVRKYGEVALELERKLQRSPTEEEILTRMGLNDVERKNFLLDVEATKIVSLDALLAGNDPDMFKAPGVIDENAADPAAVVAHNDQIELMLQQVRLLSKTHQEVLRLYFFEDMDQKDIATLFKVHRSRIGQILHEALKILRRRLTKLES